MDAGGASSDARLRAVLGDLDPPGGNAAAAAWADGFGIVAPDVQRYVDVLQPVPDAVLLAMRNLAAREGIELLDPGSAALIALLARSHHPGRVIEIGTSVGYLTLHLARAVPDGCMITSIDADPLVQGHAHAFLDRDEYECAVELRLGDARTLLQREVGEPLEQSWDMVVLSGVDAPRQELVDLLAPRMSPGALLVVPGALRGGRVADADAAWQGAEQVGAQRTLNRNLAVDVRFADVVLLPIGDGLLLGRRAI